MVMGYDYLYSLVLLVLLGFVVVTYSIRLLLRGRAQFDRVNRQGSSVLLGKGLMEMAYWSLQPIARGLVLARVTPNMLSWASLVLGGCSGVAIAYGHFGFAALSATISAFLDSLDGIVARMTSVASDAGEVLDAAIDRYVEFFFLGGLVLYYREIPLLQIVALLALAGSFMISYSTAKAEALHVPPPPGIMRRPERALYLIIGAALSPIPMPVVEAKFMFATPIALPMAIAMTMIAVLSNITAVERLYTIGREVRHRELAALEAQEREPSETEETPNHSLLQNPESFGLSPHGEI